MATNSGYVLLYDRDGDGTPVKFHAIDGMAALKHPSGRWSTTPPGAPQQETPGLKGAASPTVPAYDSGERMRLIETPFQSLRGMANTAGIPNYMSMKKAELIDALISAGAE